MKAPILTTGKGARGFNLYDGTLQEARFESIATEGDGSVGIQISRPLGTLAVSGDIVTRGGEGLSLVKGVQVTLKAIALSVKPTGIVESIAVGGALRTEGAAVTTVDVEGPVRRFSVAGGSHATGAGSDALHLAGELIELEGIAITAADGQAIRRD